VFEALLLGSFFFADVALGVTGPTPVEIRDDIPVPGLPHPILVPGLPHPVSVEIRDDRPVVGLTQIVPVVIGVDISEIKLPPPMLEPDLPSSEFSSEVI
jgi:hypothetical protein